MGACDVVQLCIVVPIKPVLCPELLELTGRDGIPLAEATADREVVD